MKSMVFQATILHYSFTRAWNNLCEWMNGVLGLDSALLRLYWTTWVIADSFGMDHAPDAGSISTIDL